ncbi:MAG: zinc ABC transporter substrate-binding protein [Elusimicrobia bacterium]|nr:zinc ABC transporter substrate-binding protein [Elusimicrobiota bacterium]
MRKIFFCGFIVLVLAYNKAFPINLSKEPKNKGKIAIAVSILPLKYFAEQIGKEKVSVSVMVPPGANPHSFEPKPQSLKELSKADIYVKVGTPLEFEIQWIGKITSLNKKALVCDSSKGITLLNYSERVLGPHSEQKEAHHHFGKDPHIWTSLRNGILMAENIKNAMEEIDSENKDFYEINYKKLKKEFEQLDLNIQAKLKPYKNKSFIVFHSAWNYFAREYGLREIPVEIGGKEPTAKELINIVNKAKSEQIKIIFVSPQFSRKSAQVIADEIGGKVIFIDNLAENILKEFIKMSELIIKSYGK